ncbi:MAG: hypothetical protein H7039_23220 [Bryobacteraceae bacterium]|nr:hypothetical protein [Bryobacteraceae bacterium]
MTPECGWAERVALAVDDRLVAVEVRQHLESCLDCQSLLAELQVDQTLLQSPPDVSEDLRANFRLRVLAATSNSRRWWFAGAVAASLVVCLAGITVQALRTLPVISYVPPRPQVANVVSPPAPVDLPMPSSSARISRSSPPAVSAGELMNQLATLLQPPSQATATSDAVVVLTTTTSDPEVIIILLADSEGVFND